MKLGGYTVDVHTGGMPQKVESGFGRIFGELLGATYKPIAYLGSKVVHGTNHAILAEQNLITGKDIKNIVLIVLNEKPGDVGDETFSIVSIEPFISDMGLAGGYTVAPSTDISAEAKEVFDKAFQGFVGSNVKPFALLATKIVKGVEYVFAAEMNMIVSPTVMKTSDTKSVALIRVFSDFSEIGIDTIIEGSSPADDGKEGGGPLGYAFTWLTGANWP